eukprot:GGOE01062649.1.p5 GENE.GGOE01062649.1~~GGOE01062649.1.p5  ORF type:complete len:111 (+),score=2.77 GGOE01062649.1:467-799(+)
MLASRFHQDPQIPRCAQHGSHTHTGATGTPLRGGCASREGERDEAATHHAKAAMMESRKRKAGRKSLWLQRNHVASTRHLCGNPMLTDAPHEGSNRVGEGERDKPDRSKG